MWRSKEFRTRRFAGLVVFCSSVLAVLLVLNVGPASGKKPPKPTEPPVDGGVIYFSSGASGVANLYSMTSDGSNKTLVLPDLTIDWTEPSEFLHNGDRWFLTALPIVGEAYPDGRERYEIFALSETGHEIQLTDDPTLQPGLPVQYQHLRWVLEDSRVSFLGRRWGLDANGDPAIVELGLYAVELEVDISQVTAPLATARVPIAYPTFVWDDDFGLGLEGTGYDWSPDGAAVVIGTGGTGTDGLWLADVASGEINQLLAPINGWPHMMPRWSPDGTVIAFSLWDVDIYTIFPDGSNLSLIMQGRTNNKNFVYYGSPLWSPTGTHLVYTRQASAAQFPWFKTDLYRATATGEDRKELTRDLPDVGVVPLGWRVE